MPGKLIVFPLLSSGDIVLGLYFLFTFLNLSYIFVIEVLEIGEFVNYKFVPCILSSFSKNSLFDGFPTLELS